MNRLQDVLEELSHEAPRPAPHPELWDRGRRLRRRDRLVGAGLVLVMVLLVGGLATLVVGPPPSVSPADDVVPGGAVPALIHRPPDRLVELPESATGESVWDDRVAEADLAVGRASLAFATGSAAVLPVVVTARDGAYHPLDLPGWLGAGIVNAGWFGGTAPLALSPDGQQLAYAWWDPTAPLDAPMPAGVRVLDLETGDLRTVPVEGGNGVRVGAIAWSPDSRWLVWRGAVTTSWTPLSGSGSGGERAAGRIAPGAVTSEPVPAGRADVLSLAVSDEGAVSMVAPGGRSLVWDGRVVSRGRGRSLDVLPTGAFSPDGSSVAVGQVTPAADAWFVDPRTGRTAPRELARGVHLYPDGAQVQPLGWIDAGLAVALVTPVDNGGGDRVTDLTPQVVLMTAPSRPRAEWTYRIVSRVETDVNGGAPVAGLTVAVDLMSLAAPAHDFPAPEWPWSDESKVVVGLLATIGLVLAAYLLWRRRGPQRPAR